MRVSVAVLAASAMIGCAAQARPTVAHRAPDGVALSDDEWRASHGAQRRLIEIASRDLACDDAKVVVTEGGNGAPWIAEGCGRRALYDPKDETMNDGGNVTVVTHDFTLRSRDAADGHAKR